MESNEHQYPELEQFIGAYFIEDFEIFGETIEEIALCYKRVVGTERIQRACSEMDKFIVDHNVGAEAAFAERWGSFDPALWGHTVASFFEELKRILNR
ncbi:contact-dependent growth inhibition system immunity protein [Achromobacter sp.]|uniref:contact-dependent growth inhibition system immunity protein n=1 Tax=Achromobacter sp. TaxID=134375 RepID=UPI0028A9AACA|nr:contact-dependent growth inhibition system immunity protein [Achromobacter sp.]